VDNWCQEIIAVSPSAISIAKQSFNAHSDALKALAHFEYKLSSYFMKLWNQKKV